MKASQIPPNDQVISHVRVTLKKAHAAMETSVYLLDDHDSPKAAIATLEEAVTDIQNVQKWIRSEYK
jgi:hypothetical protein